MSNDSVNDSNVSNDSVTELIAQFDRGENLDLFSLKKHKNVLNTFTPNAIYNLVNHNPRMLVRLQAAMKQSPSPGPGPSVWDSIPEHVQLAIVKHDPSLVSKIPIVFAVENDVTSTVDYVQPAESVMRYLVCVPGQRFFGMPELKDRHLELMADTMPQNFKFLSQKQLTGIGSGIIIKAIRKDTSLISFFKKLVTKECVKVILEIGTEFIDLLPDSKVSESQLLEALDYHKYSKEALLDILEYRPSVWEKIDLKYLDQDTLWPVVKKWPDTILKVPEIQFSQDKLKELVKLNGLAIRYVKDPDPDLDTILSAVSSNGLALKYFRKGTFQDELVYTKAIAQNNFAYFYIPDNAKTDTVKATFGACPFKMPGTTGTPENDMFPAAKVEEESFQHDRDVQVMLDSLKLMTGISFNFQLLPKSEWTPTLLHLMIKQCPSIIQHIPQDYMNPELYKCALNLDPELVEYMPNPDYSLQLLVVRTNPYNIFRIYGKKVSCPVCERRAAATLQASEPKEPGEPESESQISVLSENSGSGSGSGFQTCASCQDSGHIYIPVDINPEAVNLAIKTGEFIFERMVNDSRFTSLVNDSLDTLKYAVACWEKNLKHVKNPSDELIRYAVTEISINCLSYVPDISEEIWLEAIEIDPTCICQIESPSRKLQKAVKRKGDEYVKFINPKVRMV